MEFVYVLKRYDLFDLEFPHGFLSGDEARLETYLERIRDRGFFIERRFTEGDSGFKQVIPYVLVAHEDRLLLLERTPSQGEARLHNKQSIGVGGHLNPVDTAEGDGDVLVNGCRRELEEELILEGPLEFKPVGIINDESNAVGSVHFGIVFLLRSETGRVEVNETSMMTARFEKTDALRERIRTGDHHFETWSELILEGFTRIPWM